VDFTSLAPLAAAPGQTLSVEHIASLAPLANARLRFGLAGEALHISSAQVDVGGGQVSLDPLSIPFSPDRAWHGVVNLTGVQLAQIVENSPFGDRMDLMARVSGRAPF